MRYMRQPGRVARGAITTWVIWLVWNGALLCDLQDREWT